MPNPKDPKKLQEYKEKQRQNALRQGFGKGRKGKSYEELYGIEKASQIKKRQSETHQALCTPEECERRSLLAKHRRYGQWMQGKKLSTIHVQRIAVHKRNKSYEEIYGDRAQQERIKRQKGNQKRFVGVRKKYEDRPYQGASFRYTRWRDAVFKRDNYTCQLCGGVGEMNAHHIFFWAMFKDKRYHIDNGITLCVSCHRRIHFGKGIV